MSRLDSFAGRVASYNKRRASALKRSLLAPSKSNAGEASESFSFTFWADADPDAVEKARDRMIHFGATPEAFAHYSPNYEVAA